MLNVELLDQFKSWLLSKKNNSEITEETYLQVFSILDKKSSDSPVVSLDTYWTEIANILQTENIAMDRSLPELLSNYSAPAVYRLSLIHI